MIYLDVGHGHDRVTGRYDPGAVFGGHDEAVVVRELARGAMAVLPGVALAPDGSLSRARIPWQRRTLHGNDTLVSLHMNAGGGTGTEVYYSRRRPALRACAARMSAVVAAVLGLRDRGAKHDGLSRAGNLAILNGHPTATLLLLEIAFIDSPFDMIAVAERGADAVVRALEGRG